MHNNQFSASKLKETTLYPSNYKVELGRNN